MNLPNLVKVIRDKDLRRANSDYYSCSRTSSFTPIPKDLTIPKHNLTVRYRQKVFYFMIDLNNLLEFSNIVKRYFRTDFQMRVAQ